VRLLAARLGTSVYLPVSWDTWFDADTVRVFDDLSQPSTLLLRSGLHPLFGFIGQGMFRLIAALLPVQAPIGAIQVELSLVGAAALALTFQAARKLGCDRAGALAAVLLLGSSAAFVFMAPIPETFWFGAVTLIAAFCLAVDAPEGWRGDLRLAAAGFLAFSVTVTNAIPIGVWIVLRRKARSVLAIALAGSAMTGAASLLQARMLPGSIGWSSSLALALGEVRGDGESTRLLQSPDLLPPLGARHFAEVLRAFLLHAEVMPEPEIEAHDQGTYFIPTPLPAFSVQRSRAGGATAWGWLATAGWGALLALGLVTAHERRQRDPIRLWGIALAVQLAMHLVIGRQTFLYSPHFQPLLVGLAALASTGSWQRLARPLSIVTALAAFTNNTIVFDRLAKDIDPATPSQLRTPGDASPVGPAALRLPPGAVRVPGTPLALELGREDAATPEGFSELSGGTAIHGSPTEPGVWMLHLHRRVAGSGRLALRVFMLDPVDPSAKAAQSVGPALLVQNRFVVLVSPHIEHRTWAPAWTAACGVTMPPCSGTTLGWRGEWRIAVIDGLIRPAWGGMGGLVSRVPTSAADPRSGSGEGRAAVAPDRPG